MGSNTPLVFVELILVFKVVTLDHGDLFVTQTRQPADDLIVRAPVLKIWYQVVDRDPAGRELKPPTTID
jgi:hypothetical protein